MNTIPMYYALTRCEMIYFLPKNYSKVLEIGCGEGGFFQNLDNHCEIWGIEPDKKSIERASSSYYKTFNDFFDNVEKEIPDSYFDLVICNDVIEHMEDHNEFFYNIKQKMAPNAYLVGSIPNVRYVYNLFGLLILKDWRYSSCGILDYTHLRFFTEKSLRRTFTENSFKVNKFCGINSVFNRRKTKIIFIENIITALIIIITFGFYHDIKFPQFGFQLQK
ncbi:MAG: class I SAM-dependent methyltransferase [Methylovulum sp.]|nr:class I SAM-dependent methyltransferase [Methylovulum sp.]